MDIALLLVLAVAVFIIKSVKVVPQQHAWIVERLGRYHRTLEPGLNLIIPFIDRVAYRHILKEFPLDVPSQVCITRDNTQLTVDGVLYFLVTDPKLASYGSSNYVVAITQLAQTTLRSVIGRMELDKTFEERNDINHSVVAVLDEAAVTWGVKVLRYEIKDLVPPNEILKSMQNQITAEREKRGRIADSEGKMTEQINIANGTREAEIQKSEGERQATINRAAGQAQALQLVADATAHALTSIATALNNEGGWDAARLKVAEQYVEAFAKLAQQGNTLILPANIADMGGLIAAAMNVITNTSCEKSSTCGSNDAGKR